MGSTPPKTDECPIKRDDFNRTISGDMLVFRENDTVDGSEILRSPAGIYILNLVTTRINYVSTGDRRISSVNSITLPETNNVGAQLKMVGSDFLVSFWGPSFLAGAICKSQGGCILVTWPWKHIYVASSHISSEMLDFPAR